MSDFIIHDLSERKYFAMVPHIIHEIELDVYEIAVYCAIKRSAGDDGDCIRSKKNLAKQSGNISTRKLVQVLHSLALINKHLKKPLIIYQHRDHEYGDSDTNLLKIVDIWIENIALCKENEKQKVKSAPGGAPHSPPHALYSPQGVHAIQGGGAPHAPKEDTLKKNTFKKTSTTPTPSKGKAEEVVVSKNKITTKDKEAAKSLKDWLDKEAFKERRRKTGRYYEDVQWGESWIIPLHVFEMLIVKYGLIYFKEQLENMHRQQMDFDKGTSKKPIGKPETVLKMSCKNNYAEYVDLK